MNDVLKMLTDAVVSLLPVLAATLGPVVTAAVKAAVGDSLPASVKPLINAIAGAALAGLAGGDPTTGVMVAMGTNVARSAYKNQ